MAFVGQGREIDIATEGIGLDGRGCAGWRA